MKYIFGLFAGLLFSVSFLFAQTVRLGALDLSSMEIGWASPQVDKSVDGNRITIAGKQYDHGVGTHAVSTFLLRCDGKAKKFSAVVGVDDEVKAGPASIEFFVLADRKVLWRSGVMKKGDAARQADVPLGGVKYLGLLVTDAGDGIDYDHADWADAVIELTAPVSPADMVPPIDTARYILTPPVTKEPKINGARVIGVRPGNPLLYTVAATGEGPLVFTAAGLPAGVTMNSQNGIIAGVIQNPGVSTVTLTAANKYGTVTSRLKIVAGEHIALTPPMGWNSWNCWAEAVDAAKVRASADALVKSGLQQHGWTYINIDDCWMVKPNSADKLTRGVAREPDGKINSNRKFPDMKALSAYVHRAGLKLGIYSSPGPTTCAGFTASYQHERQDAERFAEWGIDYLKYDWCSYGSIARDKSLPELKKPYVVMQSALKQIQRDIVYSLCQYGMGNVWEWGDEVGGNCWRTTGDINDSWSSMAGIGFGQAGHERFAGPGHWNDPDMLVVGNVGWGPQLHPSKLTPDEQYTHLSLWSMLSAPLLIGCDLTSLDDFTLNLLSNDEVIAVDQDPLGAQARRIAERDGIQIWVKDMEDGSKTVGVFNVGTVKRSSPEEYFDWEGKTVGSVTVTADEIGMAGKFTARDLWRQKNIGSYQDRMTVDVRKHGVVLLRLAPVH
jgi:alpha-galactosidase